MEEVRRVLINAEDWPWSSHRVIVKHTNTTKTWHRFRIRCLDGEACTFEWLLYYYTQKAGHVPGTLLCMARGQHNHTDTRASGKLWTPDAQRLATAFVTEATSAKTSPKTLRQYLLGAGCSEDSLPTPTQMRNWRLRFRKANRPQVQPGSSMRVEPVRQAIADFAREQPEGNAAAKITNVQVLPQPLVTGERVFVPFTCRGMRELLPRIAGDTIHLALDGKMKVLNTGGGAKTSPCQAGQSGLLWSRAAC